MSCTALVNPNIAEIAWCGLTMATGSELLLVIVLFCCFLYGIHKIGLPYQVFIPIGIMLIFVFAGAGTGLPLGGIDIFMTLLWIVIIIVGAIITLTIWELRKGG